MRGIFSLVRSRGGVSLATQRPSLIRSFTRPSQQRAFATGPSANVSNTFSILGLVIGVSAIAYTGHTAYQIYGRNQSWFLPYRYQTIKFGPNIEQDQTALEDKILEEVLFVATPTVKSTYGLPLNIVKYKVNQISGPPPKRIVTGFTISRNRIEKESREIHLHGDGETSWEEEFSYSFQGELTISSNEQSTTATTPDSGTIYFTAKIPVHDMSLIHLQKAQYIANGRSSKTIDLLAESKDANSVGN
ncbi:hypothetical protein K493DRAFT_316573 [Basidiobolus meristosporus CBS 931.73]|uniref:Uncharacterized protein n=1 Tax=Basidiobolus meristosporus CBS 931.73 TaxID=1314790 RepID=A0A1Y1Y3A9_9FUNG|nr:hypothetical protein K493DRAFT_316573 [Basidiobolus meristosporus CBS 931.73]|eukprot:ORX92478.1 hypothetical protein K493DRAFT_316573 [Basidiobolus meristosporus CBS 931.73]